jgi:tellurite resistance protein TerC
VLLALVFGAVFSSVTNATLATDFCAGWLTEYSLSVDNLFVFVIIMARFRVLRHLQQELTVRASGGDVGRAGTVEVRRVP